MTRQFEKEIEALWQERIATKYLYRGMSACDLKDPLDPRSDPFQAVRPQLFHLIEVLERAVAEGFTFTVHEDHSGLSFDLKDILKWSRGDLEHPGLDFTSSYENAVGYSRNFQGSQLKQNFKYITDQLIRQRKNCPRLLRMTDQDWNAMSILQAWLSKEMPPASRVIIWVRRSLLMPNRDSCLPLGSLPAFTQSITEQLKERQLPMTLESARSILPNESQEFCYRLTEPLLSRNIERIEEQET